MTFSVDFKVSYSEKSLVKMRSTPISSIEYSSVSTSFKNNNRLTQDQLSELLPHIKKIVSNFLDNTSSQEPLIKKVRSYCNSLGVVTCLSGSESRASIGILGQSGTKGVLTKISQIFEKAVNSTIGVRIKNIPKDGKHTDGVCPVMKMKQTGHSVDVLFFDTREHSFRLFMKGVSEISGIPSASKD